MFYLTGIQHTKTGDIAIPNLAFDTADGYKARYHQEMSYAMASSDFDGLTIIVFDNAGNIVLFDNWTREKIGTDSGNETVSE